MILETMDFGHFYNNISNIFQDFFTEEQMEEFMEFVHILADANFRCYKSNMLVIASRKKGEQNYKLVSDLEWVARSVGEYRVASKANINRFIHNVKTTKEVTAPEGWISDDIVYSIGEIMDRLSIETIKREDFRVNNRPDHMRAASQELSGRVERYLISKLKEIDKKGFYECVHEQRTYSLEGILNELVL